MLLEALLNFLPLARKMKCVKVAGTRVIGPSCREYFILLLRLVDTLPSKRTEKEVRHSCSSCHHLRIVISIIIIIIIVHHHHRS